MSKYLEIHHEIRDEILKQRLRSGHHLPSDMELVKKYGVSRPTVAKALKLLESEGMIARKPGVGTFVTDGPEREDRQFLFGLAFPETPHGEIFDPIMNGIASLRNQCGFGLLWSPSGDAHESFRSDDLSRFFDELIEHKVDGVFFAPLEGSPSSREANRDVARLMNEAGIAVVLIDRDIERFPDRSPYPLVALDSVQAGYVLTEHLLAHSPDRVDFIGLGYDCFTTDLRIIGYRAALLDHGISPDPAWIHRGDPDRLEFVRSMLEGNARDIICTNDETAALFLNSLRELSVNVPSEVRVVGIDDIKYARLISVPLTTIRQPVALIAERAVELMMRAVNSKVRGQGETVLLNGELVVRSSTLVEP